MLLFADDVLIIQENEYALQKSLYDLQELSNNYNFNISTTKKKLWLLKESTQFDQK
jgi:hypothetical protein